MEESNLFCNDLPNGTQIVSAKRGSVALGENFNLSKVLFVLDLSCNLVYIAKITKELNCIVTFFDDSCILQDRTLRMSIGVGRQRDGFYYFGKAPLKIQSNVVRTTELWQKQMGNPSNEVISFFTKELGFSDHVRKKNNVCDVSYHAKQTT